MKRRLLVGTIGIPVLCVVLLGVPLIVLARHEVWTSARDRLKQQAASAAVDVEDRLELHRALDLRPLLRFMPDRRITVTDPRGNVVTTAGPAQPQPFSAHAAAADYQVSVQAPQGPVIERARSATAVLLALISAALLAAVGLAFWQARRLAAPVARLLERADDLGHGDFTAPTLISGIPEIDAVAHALDASARQIGSLVDRQREFATDAAHQLRTPLTSVALHLDEIAAIGDTTIQADVEEALTQVERLAAVITAFLARARGDAAPPEDLDLSALIADGCRPYARLLQRDGRRLNTHITPSVHVRARSEHLHGVLSSLLENALVHGAGTVTVSVRHDIHSASVSVRDEGAGVPPALADSIFERHVSGARSSGIGLGLARALTVSEHGTLRLDPPATFVITLPRLRANPGD